MVAGFSFRHCSSSIDNKMKTCSIIVVVKIVCATVASGYLVETNSASTIIDNQKDSLDSEKKVDVFNNVGDEGAAEQTAASAFDGVYSECFLYLSYSCIQRKTLLYLSKINDLQEVSILGDYLKFVKINITNKEEENRDNNEVETDINSNDLSILIDKSIDYFFDRHILRVNALGKDISVQRTVEEFVGRKRKGGGGGHGGGGGGHGDGGKKKMMMMAMMCMKMKLMMMIPAMMGMMGMMSFKGMMFSMMSFMIAKMMLLMKLLEKKNGAGAGSGGDGGWPAGGGAGGAWMPAAGGQDGGAGGGYDANGQWQSRSIIAQAPEENWHHELEPLISSVASPVKHNNKMKGKRQIAVIKNLNDEIIKINNESVDYTKNAQENVKSRRKRDIIDVLQNAYHYWTKKILGYSVNKRPNSVAKQQKYKVVNGVKYVFYPNKYLIKGKTPKAVQTVNAENVLDDAKMVITAEDFNKGEIVEGGVEGRMRRKKLDKMKQTVEEALEDNPWQ